MLSVSEIETQRTFGLWQTPSMTTSFLVLSSTDAIDACRMHAGSSDNLGIVPPSRVSLTKV